VRADVLAHRSGEKRNRKSTPPDRTRDGPKGSTKEAAWRGSPGRTGQAPGAPSCHAYGAAGCYTIGLARAERQPYLVKLEVVARVLRGQSRLDAELARVVYTVQYADGHHRDHCHERLRTKTNRQHGPRYVRMHTSTHSRNPSSGPNPSHRCRIRARREDQRHTRAEPRTEYCGTDRPPAPICGTHPGRQRRRCRAVWQCHRVRVKGHWRGPVLSEGAQCEIGGLVQLHLLPKKLEIGTSKAEKMAMQRLMALSVAVASAEVGARASGTEKFPVKKLAGCEAACCMPVVYRGCGGEGLSTQERRAGLPSVAATTADEPGLLHRRSWRRAFHRSLGPRTGLPPNARLLPCERNARLQARCHDHDAGA